MDDNNSVFLILGFVFAVLGLTTQNLAFGIIGLTFLIVGLSTKYNSDDDDKEV